MFGVFTQTIQAFFAPYDFAIHAHCFYRSSNLHVTNVGTLSSLEIRQD